MVKIQDDFLFRMFQEIVDIDYLKCVKLWEGGAPDILILSGTK